MATSSKPLDGLTVLDLSRVLAGPWATQHLADLGARVIKVERPGVGDDTRRWGPPFVPAPDGAPGDATYFHCCNRGKRSIGIDFTRPEGAAVLRRLAARADVLIENHKVGSLQRYGLDYAALRELNPRLIYCSITGFGQTGPYADRPGYDALIQAMGGLMSVTGEPDGAPGGGPQKVGVAVVDLLAGMYALSSVLAALLGRTTTGLGTHIDISLLDVQVAMLANQASAWLLAGTLPQRWGTGHPSIVPYQAFACADGHVMLAIGNDGQFHAFCEAAGAAHLAADPRYRNNRGRVEHRGTLVPALTQILRGKRREEWIALGEAHGFPCGPINTIDQVFADPQVQARGMVTTLHGKRDEVRSVSSPMRFDGISALSPVPPPALGDSTEEVLGELGYSTAEIAALRASAVL